MSKLIKLNHDSVYNNFCKETESDQVMIYGFAGACKYMEIIEALNRQAQDSQNKIRKAYDFSVGFHPEMFKKSKTETIEGREIDRINWSQSHDFSKMTSRQCKAGITNMVLENYKREKEGLSIIPVIFSIDAKDNKFAVLNSESLTSRTLKNNSKLCNDCITVKEIRRAYKLCYDPSVNKEIRQVAKKTFKFAKLNHQLIANETEHFLEQIPAPWESEDFTSKWEKRVKTRKESSGDKISWREELNTKIKNYHKKF